MEVEGKEGEEKEEEEKKKEWVVQFEITGEQS